MTLYVQPVLLAFRTRTRQRAGVGVAVGGTGVGDDVAVGAVFVAVAVGGELVAVAVAGTVETGEFVAVGADVESDHLEKSLAMQPSPVVYQPSSANDRFTLCVPSATGTK